MPTTRIAALCLALLGVAFLASPARAQGPASTLMPFDTTVVRVVTCAACHGRQRQQQVRRHAHHRGDGRRVLQEADPGLCRQCAAVARDGSVLQADPRHRGGRRRRLLRGTADGAHAGEGRRGGGGARPHRLGALRDLPWPPTARATPPRAFPASAGQPPGYLRDQMRLFRQDARNPGDAALAAMKALMKSIPEAQEADLAAYYSSLR